MENGSPIYLVLEVGLVHWILISKKQRHGSPCYPQEILVEFVSLLVLPGAPATEAEMYLVATTLDTDNDNVIDYHEFAKLRRQYRACSGTFQKAADLPSPEIQSMVQQQYLQPCPGCGLGLWQPVDEDMPRFEL